MASRMFIAVLRSCARIIHESGAAVKGVAPADVSHVHVVHCVVQHVLNPVRRLWGVYAPLFLREKKKKKKTV